MAEDDLATLTTQVLAGLEKRGERFLIKLFNKYKDADTNLLPVSELSNALLETSICESDETKLLPSEISCLHDQTVDFETLKKISQKPSALDQWAQSVPIWQLLSDAIPRKKGVRAWHCATPLFLS
jgi:hypothetical protein